MFFHFLKEMFLLHQYFLLLNLNNMSFYFDHQNCFFENIILIIHKIFLNFKFKNDFFHFYYK